ncbi:recombinase family protein [Paracoccaceae bacterium]|jgi:DNA invertase Pin-like site-specific DNA recombinase|nr:recombinase family protein [Paracoccaceae bacterium]|tara:strand:- start:851 stop:1450 length:600 start_codon:yes stop_codon:yes gene_type:complete
MENVVIYSRVSTKDQNCANQIQFLQKIVDQNGWNLVDSYVDVGISGSKGRESRKEFDRLNKDMVRRKFNRILVWDISRLGRSLQHLVEFLNELNSIGCNLYIHQSGLDTSTPNGKMMFQMIGVFSEFEREMISERVKLGLERVKSKGKKLGRPKKVDLNMVIEMTKLRDIGWSQQKISDHFGISKMSISRSLRSAKIQP